MNVLYHPLPEEWEGYRVNIDFQTGVQIYQLLYDESLTPEERAEVMAELLFSGQENERLPQTPEELQGLMTWYFSGWNHDHTPEEKQRQRLVDYDVDQWRIYADFRAIYGINLNDVDLHFWEFQAMLWNMPARQSSFLQVVEIRQKEIDSKMSAKEKAAILKAKRLYAISQPEAQREYNDDEKAQIDEYDERMKQIQEKRDVLEQIKRDFEA